MHCFGTAHGRKPDSFVLFAASVRGNAVDLPEGTVKIGIVVHPDRVHHIAGCHTVLKQLHCLVNLDLDQIAAERLSHHLLKDLAKIFL